MNTGVIIARFQTPYLHQGHKSLIAEVRKQHSKLVVLLGISPVAGSRRNPYDYYTRERMIKREFADIVVLPISDQPSDFNWSQNLDSLLRNSFPSETFLLYGSRDSFIPHYHGKFPTIELPEHGDYNATELRKKYADLVLESNDFRAGILYAYHHQYAKVYATVDVAVFRNNRTEILLGTKAINNKLRLPGGFTDPEDESFEEAAKRELTEECGDIEVGELIYELSRRVEDWRYRNEVDKIITTVYSCDFVAGNPQAQDDIMDLQWVALQTIPSLIETGQVSEEHIPLLQHLLNKYQQ